LHDFAKAIFCRLTIPQTVCADPAAHVAWRDRALTSLAGRAFAEAARLVPQRAVLPFAQPAAVFFHGVEKHLDDPGLQINHHRRDAFIAMMRELRAHFDVLPLSALDGVLKNPRARARALFLMADDGYANMLDAADILEELGLPWTLFVSTRHIGSGERNPMFRARAFLRYAPIGAYLLPHVGRVDFLTRERGLEETRVLRLLKTLDAARAHETLDAMVAALAEAGLADLARLFSSDAFLSWEQVRRLAARGVAIGAHAHWHWPMNAHQRHDHLVEQAMLPKTLIEAEVGPCTAFAYPFGNAEDVTRAAWRAVRDAGYACAFTTLSGTLGPESNRYLLPRHALAPQVEGTVSRIALLRAGNLRLRRWQDGSG
jgi:peptidoglycan/xylan/chitin deacetylase (PgdA/CDA1 family)